METKVVSPKTFLYHEGKTSLSKIHDYANGVVYEIYDELKKSGIEENGPLEFIYFGAESDMDKEFTLQIAMPVKEEKEVSNGFRFKRSEPFKCVSHVYKGDVDKMGPVYEDLYKQLSANHLQPKDEIREVYVQWENPQSANNITEIQIGID